MQKGSWSPAQNISEKKSKASYKQQRTIVKRRFKDVQFKEKNETAKPEWLKQWTISKGWMHNRSHLLSLGVNENPEENLLDGLKASQPPKKVTEIDSVNSSISTDDIDDLLSVSNTSPSGKHDFQDLDKIETISESDDGAENFNETLVQVQKNANNIGAVFTQVSSNYRRNFPDNFERYNNDLELPEIYKERLLLSKVENTNLLLELWRFIKPRRKSKADKNCKFTLNKIYDDNEVASKPSVQMERNDSNLRTEYNASSINSEVKYSRLSKSTLGQNIATYNTLRSKTNLLEDTIYECSEREESLSLYHNPLYGTVPEQEAPKIKYYDFHTNHAVRPQSFVSRRYQLAKQNENVKFDSMKYRIKTEKYIIRHIKVRIMLSLKIGRFQKTRERPSNTKSLDRQHLLFRDNSEQWLGEGSLREKTEKMHEEQRRIGNGKTSIKIQNMRYSDKKLFYFYHSCKKIGLPTCFIIGVFYTI